MTPDELLRAYHARHPGATARAFGGGRSEDGRSTYDLLADLPSPGDAVLDLGCGDGHLLELLIRRGCRDLVGVDMSPEELARAAARPALAGVRLLEARAQALPVAPATFDWVLSHLAFNVMSDVDAAAAEVARVLRPGGRMAAVVGGAPADEEDAFGLFLRLFQEIYQASGERAPRLGDRRTRDAAGLASLLHPGSGFDAAIEEVLVTVRFDGPPDQVWDVVATMYEMIVVPPDGRAALRARFLADAHADADGQVRCAMRCRLLVATRSAAA